MKFFIPGGAGYIGTHIAYMLIDEGHDVVILDNFSNSSISSIHALEKLVNKNITLYKGNICDDEMLSQIFTDHNFEAVIHLAALKSVSESILNPKDYFRNNFEGTLCLLNAMDTSNLKNIIFSSSATIYGIPKYLPIDESHPLSSINPYAETKLRIEKALNDFAKNDDSWKIVSLRYFNPIGAHESGMIGENPRDIPNNIMPYIVKVANKELPYINIFGKNYETNDGTGVRDYIHVMDLADAHKCAIDYLFNRDSLILSLNVGTGVGTSVLNLVETFQEVNKCEIPYKFCNRRPGDVPTLVADNKKAISILNWYPKRNIRDMCKDGWNWRYLNPKGYKK